MVGSIGGAAASEFASSFFFFGFGFPHFFLAGRGGAAAGLFCLLVVEDTFNSGRSELIVATAFSSVLQHHDDGILTRLMMGLLRYVSRGFGVLGAITNLLSTSSWFGIADLYKYCFLSLLGSALGSSVLTSVYHMMIARCLPFLAVLAVFVL